MIQKDDVTTPDRIADSTIQNYRSRGFVRIPQIISIEEAAHFHQAASATLERLRHKDYSRTAVFTQMDAETTYTGAKHVITDPLGLQIGDLLDTALFPRAGTVSGIVSCQI